MSIGPWVFNGFDIVVLLVVFISLLMAGSRGFFREIISICALLGALVAMLFVWGRFRYAAQDMIQPSWLADGALGVGTFLLTYMLIAFLLSGITKTLRGKNVGLLDRLAGAGFGAARGILVAALFVMLMSANYREAKEMQEFSASLTPEQREVMLSAPQQWRDMLENKKEAKLPALFVGSTFYGPLDKVGAGIRKLPFGKFKTMAEELKDGGDLETIVRDMKND
ncbi:MAG: CvpA family protein [Alphaproteobacteria bacterium]